MGSSWTPKQNKLFENALAIYSKDSPDRWHNVARAVGGNKTIDDVMSHYDKLVHDVSKIIPLPDYHKIGSSKSSYNNSYVDAEKRFLFYFIFYPS